MRAILITLLSIVLLAGFTGCDSGGGAVDVLDPTVIYNIEGDWMTTWIHGATGFPYPLRITKIDSSNYTVRLYSCGDNLHTGIRTGNELIFDEVPPITLTYTDADHFIMTRDIAPDYMGVKCIGDCLYGCP